MNKKDAVSRRLNIPWLKIIFAVTLLATIAGALVSTKTLADINKNIAAAKEAARPANIKIIKITTPNCTDCFNINEAVLGFKKLNVKVEEEKTLVFDSPEASTSIKQYAIKKVPTFLVTGDVNKNNLENYVKSYGEIKNNTFIFTKLLPVFIDTATGKEMGKITATLITDSSCSQCIDLKQIVENFKKSGVKVKETKEFAWNSLDGQRIINQYKITNVPAFIFSPEFDLYGNNVKNNWQNLGTVEQDKTYVARNLPLPYRDLTKRQMAGLVDIIYLTDSTCSDCYKVSNIQKPILTKGFGVVLQSERTVDAASAEGQSLTARYSITKVPTILLSPQADRYSNLKKAWTNVGTIGSDGWYVFREFNQLGNITYKDLTNNKIIRPEGQSNPDSTK